MIVGRERIWSNFLLVSRRIVKSQQRRSFRTLGSKVEGNERLGPRETDSLDLGGGESNLELDLDYLRFVGADVPWKLTEKMRKTLEAETSSERRRKLYRNFAEMEKRNELRKEENSNQSEHRTKTIEKRTRERMKENFRGEIYDERGVSPIGPPLVIVPKLDSNYARKVHNHRMNFAMKFGQTIALDLNFPSFASILQPLMELYAVNRSLWEPFNIVLCGFDENREDHLNLLHHPSTRNQVWSTTPLPFSQEFPSDRIVYLSTEATEPLKEYRHDDVLVMGAHSGGGQRLLAAEAAKIKRLGLRAAKLDTNSFFVNVRKPSFRLGEMLQVLADARDTDGNWFYAFRRFGGEKSPVRWRPRFRPTGLSDLSKSAGKKSATRIEEELIVNRIADRYLVNERAIFKPTARR